MESITTGASDAELSETLGIDRGGLAIGLHVLGSVSKSRNFNCL